MLGVCHRVTNDLAPKVKETIQRGWRNDTHIFKENLENTAGLLVDEARDTFDTTTTGKTTDGGLGNTLDVIPQNFPVTLGSALSETFPSL